MLSYKKCIELRDNGFPQPEPAFGQFWYAWEGITTVGEVFETEQGILVGVHPMGGGFLVEPINICVYSPTVEDMLSMLSPGYCLERVVGSGWAVIYWKVNKERVVIQMGGSPIDVLAKAWVNRRDIFEDNGRQEGGADK